MGSLLSGLNIKTFVAVTAFIVIDRQFDLSGKVLRTVGLTPAR